MQVQVAEPVVAEDPAPAVAAPLVAAPAGSALSQLDAQAGTGELPTALGSPALGASAGLGGLAAPPPRPLTYTGPAEDGGTEVQGGGNRARPARNGSTEPSVVGGQEPSRNAPCPCGSGRKYKRCHGAPTTARS
ncbi:MAG: SEC-C metal-binding domain-containing protein [Pseudonocardiaceae bacterium]